MLHPLGHVMLCLTVKVSHHFLACRKVNYTYNPTLNMIFVKKKKIINRCIIVNRGPISHLFPSQVNNFSPFSVDIMFNFVLQYKDICTVYSTVNESR